MMSALLSGASARLGRWLALNRWPELFQSEAQVDRDIVAAYYPRILKFFSGVKIQPSAPDSDQHFVQVEGEGELNLVIWAGYAERGDVDPAYD